MRRSLPLLATLTAEVGAIVLLYRFIREPGFAIPIAFGFAAWLLSSTLLYLGARLAQIPVAIRSAGRVTLPALRRRVDRALAASILTGALVAGAPPAFAAAPPGPDPVVDAAAAPSQPAASPDKGATPDAPDPSEPVEEETTTSTTLLAVRSGRAGDPAAIVTASTTTELPVEREPTPPSTQPTPPSTESTPSSTETAQPSTGSTPDRVNTTREPPQPPEISAPLVAQGNTTASYTVAPDDNFWEIAARHLAAVTGRDREVLSDGDIAEYWTRVCGANRDRIQSGDVSLIYSGEVVELPPV